MTMAACICHQPMHTFGRGYHCAVCGVELLVPDYMSLPISPRLGDVSSPLVTPSLAAHDGDKSAVSISHETQKALDDIDSNIRAAHITAKTAYLD